MMWVRNARMDSDDCVISPLTAMTEFTLAGGEALSFSMT